MGAEVVRVWDAFAYGWHQHGSWLEVDFILAVAPAVGAFILYHWWRYLFAVRWLLLVAVALLLPNAPYVVTDLVHWQWMGWAPTRLDRDASEILLGALIASGVFSYAYTMHLIRRIMRRRGWPRRPRAAVEISIDAVCAVGVALGRVSRLNSWDVIRPDRLSHGLYMIVSDPRSLVLAGIIVVLADVPVDRLASGVVHLLQSRLRHHRRAA
jgi:uncharacterized membrane protein